MKEFKVVVGIGSDNKVVDIEPLKKSDSNKPVRYCKMTCRLLTEQEVDREASECMQQDCHTYTRVNHRVHQKR